MHKQVQEWLLWCKGISRKAFVNRRVLEVGSRDINGTNRKHFSGCTYTGLDCQAGPNVDVVGLAHEVQLAPASFDTVISTELLEHDPHWRLTLAAMKTWLRPGGAMIVTCATHGRAEHGVAEGYGPNRSYYQNLDAQHLLEVLPSAHFDLMVFSLEHSHHDLRFFGIKGK
jgi:hypothetical protein